MKTQKIALETHGVWDLVEPPPDAEILPGKWVFDEKMTPEGEWLNRARWVVCGNYERDSWSIQDVYAAVATSTTVKIFLAITAVQGHFLRQYDFKTAFLNAHIPKGTSIYVRQPHGLPQEEGKVCLLRMALYGLRKAPLYWFLTLVPVMKALGFDAFQDDLCLFHNKKTGALVVLYVDDLLISAPTLQAIEETRDLLNDKFMLKDLGEAKSFLGFDIIRDWENSRIYLSQENYAKKMLAKYNLEGLNGVNTPWPAGLELPKTWEKPDATITKSYIKKTGSLNYLAVGSRADLTYTVSRLCEANAGPSDAHIRLLQHLFRYITKTLTLCPCYGGKLPMDNLALCAYADAAFADDLLMRYSTGGHVVFLAGGPILWKSKKQGIITLSSTEAEFINLTPTGLSLKWVARLLEEYGAPQKAPLLLYTDSANARTTVLSPYNTARTRNLDVRFKWIINQVSDGNLNVQHIAGTEMVADGLTKPLQKEKHAKFVKLLNLVETPSSG
jgi:hypothetical protein